MRDLPNLDQLWDYNDPAATEERFRALLPAARQSGDQGYQAELLTQIARAGGLQSRFEYAHRVLDEAQALLPAGPSRARVRYLLERGRVYSSSGLPTDARPLFAEAWDMARACHEDFYAIDAAHMLGIAATPDDRLAWNLKALAHAERSSDPRARRWLGLLYNHIGWIYHDAGRYREALDMFQKSLAWRTEQGVAREIRIASWTVARALRSLGRLDEALAIQRRLAGELARTGADDGYVEEELAELLLALGREAEARPHFARAYAALCHDPWLASYEPDRLRRMEMLAGRG